MNASSDALSSNIFATVMAGGAGTRFWPASRQKNPKQLLNLVGERSMLQSTIDRLSGFCPPENLLILTNSSLTEPIAKQLPDIPAANVIGEPAKRDTAPCVALAAALIVRMNPDATMVVMPADHVISPDEVFQSAMKSAASLVDQNPSRIVTFGIAPSYPAEVFGYIERGDAISGASDFPTYSVQRFREKPDSQTARQFLDAGTFYWNAGIFVWKAQTVLDAIAEFEPQIMSHIDRISDAIGSDDYDDVLQREFCAIKGTSIDYAVMERYPDVNVIEAPFQWDDLGNWSAIPSIRGTDDQGNSVDAKHLNIGSTDCVVYSQSDHLLVTVGMQNCIVVHTDDATLVADRSEESAIKQIVEQLKDRKLNEYL